LEKGANLSSNHVVEYSSSPLQKAATNGKIEIVRLFCEASPTNQNCQQALVEACEHGNTKLVQALIRAGVDVDSKSWPMGMTGLHVGTLKQKTEIVGLLVNAGANISHTSDVLASICKNHIPFCTGTAYDIASNPEIAIMVCPWYDTPTQVLWGLSVLKSLFLSLFWSTMLLYCTITTRIGQDGYTISMHFMTCWLFSLLVMTLRDGSLPYWILLWKLGFLCFVLFAFVQRSKQVGSNNVKEHLKAVLLLYCTFCRTTNPTLVYLVCSKLTLLVVPILGILIYAVN
jgi:hypothetical protein